MISRPFHLFVPVACASLIIATACGSPETATTMENVPATGSSAPAEQDLNTATDVDADLEQLGPDISAATGYIDPVCQMAIAEDAAHRHTHDGVTYGFCSAGCKGAFAKDPDAFLVALEE